VGYIAAMSIQVFGLPVSRGVAIGRAVLVASSRVDVEHYFVTPDRVEHEILRLRDARDGVAHELQALKQELPAEARTELAALLDVHLMLLHDESLTGATKAWIVDRHYNAEWALSAQLEVLAQGRHRAGGGAPAARTGRQRGGRVAGIARGGQGDARLRRRGPAGAGGQ
jgi:phosphoenolpyruvate-protein kinase (PTS system EI component)